MFRRLRAARWQVLAAAGAVALVCTGCGAPGAPRALGKPAQGPILSLVTALKLNGYKPRGITQYFAVKDRSVYAAAAFLGDLHGATQMVTTWSRLTSRACNVPFTEASAGVSLRVRRLHLGSSRRGPCRRAPPSGQRLGGRQYHGRVGRTAFTPATPRPR